MKRGCLFEILLAGLIVLLFILLYLRYLEPYIKGSGEALKKIEEITGERRIKGKRRRLPRLEREETERETTGIEELDEYQRALKEAQQKLRRIRKSLVPR